MSIFPEFEKQLRELPDRTQQTSHAPVTEPKRRSRVGWLGRVSLAVSVLVVVAIAVTVVALVARHPGPASQTVSSAVMGADHRAELRYIGRASRKADTLALCHTKTPKAVSGTPPQAFLSILGSLRATSKPITLPRSFRRQLQGVYVRHTRLALRARESSYWLAPVSQTSSDARLTTAGCEKATLAALNAELPQIPQRLRAPTKALARRQLQVLRGLSGEGVCLLIEHPDAFAQSCTDNAHALKTEGMWTPYGLLSGVVPDGVARVKIRYDPGQGKKTQTDSVLVVDNVFATDIKLTNHGVNVYPTITWKAANGTTIKTLHTRGAATGSDCGGRPHSHLTAHNNPCS